MHFVFWTFVSRQSSLLAANKFYDFRNSVYVFVQEINIVILD